MEGGKDSQEETKGIYKGVFFQRRSAGKAGLLIEWGGRLLK